MGGVEKEGKSKEMRPRTKTESKTKLSDSSLSESGKEIKPKTKSESKTKLSDSSLTDIGKEIKLKTKSESKTKLLDSSLSESGKEIKPKTKSESKTKLLDISLSESGTKPIRKSQKKVEKPESSKSKVKVEPDKSQADGENEEKEIELEAKATVEATPRIIKKGDKVIKAYVDEKTGKIAVYEPGIKLEVRDVSNVDRWYPARVVEVKTAENEILVHFEKWSARYDERIKMDSERLRPSVDTNIVKIQFKINEKVEASWGNDGQRYPGVIHSILPNDYYEILFDDGIKWKKKYNQIFKTKRLTRLVSRNSKDKSEEDGGPPITTPMDLPLPSSVPHPAESQNLAQALVPVVKPIAAIIKALPALPSVKTGKRGRPSIESKELQLKAAATQPLAETETSAKEGEIPSLPPLPALLPIPGLASSPQLSLLPHSIFSPVSTELGKRKRNIHDYSLLLKRPQKSLLEFEEEKIAKVKKRLATLPVMKTTEILTPDKLVEIPHQESEDHRPKLVPKKRRSTKSLEKANLPEEDEEPSVSKEPEEFSTPKSGKQPEKKKKQETLKIPLKTPQESKKEEAILDSPIVNKTPQKEAAFTHLSAFLTTPLTPSRLDSGFVDAEGKNVYIEQSPDGGWICPISNCGKNFRKDSLLQMHLKHYHPEIKSQGQKKIANVVELAKARNERLNEYDDYHFPIFPFTPPPIPVIPQPLVEPVIPLQTEPQEPIPSPEVSTKKTARRSSTIKIKTSIPDTPVAIEEPGEGKVEIKEDTQISVETSKEDAVNKMHVAVRANKIDESLDDLGKFKHPSQIVHEKGKPDASMKSRRKDSLSVRNEESCQIQDPAIVSLKDSARGIESPGKPDGEEAEHEEETPETGRKKLTRRGSTAARRFFVTRPYRKKSGKDKVETLLNGLSSRRIANLRKKVFEKKIPFKFKSDLNIKDVSVDIINCECDSKDEFGLMIQCEQCQCWQHGNCFGIQDETQLENFYVCASCKDPLNVRPSSRHEWGAEFYRKGNLPTFANVPKLDPVVQKRLKSCHELAERLFTIKNYLRSTQIKMKIGIDEVEHPKLYQWAKPPPSASDQLKMELFQKNYRAILRRLLRAHQDDPKAYAEQLKTRIRAKLQASAAIKNTLDQAIISNAASANVGSQSKPSMSLQDEQPGTSHAIVQEEKMKRELLAKRLAAPLIKSSIKKSSSNLIDKGNDTQSLPSGLPVGKLNVEEKNQIDMNKANDVTCDKLKIEEKRPNEPVKNNSGNCLDAFTKLSQMLTSNEEKPIGEQPVAKGTEETNTNEDVVMSEEPEFDSVGVNDHFLDKVLEKNTNNLESLANVMPKDVDDSDIADLNIFSDDFFTDPMQPEAAANNPSNPICEIQLPERITAEKCKVNLFNEVEQQQDMLSDQMDLIDAKVSEYEKEEEEGSNSEPKDLQSMENELENILKGLRLMKRLAKLPESKAFADKH